MYATFVIYCVTALIICITVGILSILFYYRHQAKFWKARAGDWYRAYSEILSSLNETAF